MRVKALRRFAWPEGCASAGQVVEVPAEFGLALVAWKYAVVVTEQATVGPAETADRHHEIHERHENGGRARSGDLRPSSRNDEYIGEV